MLNVIKSATKNETFKVTKRKVIILTLLITILIMYRCFAYTDSKDWIRMSGKGTENSGGSISKAFYAHNITGYRNYKYLGNT